ncbi:hypothetical protein K2Q02_02765 [Patescibacteria group bacterium]|nr:hypothetical protein [Patescibacteria group bacterium]
MFQHSIKVIESIALVLFYIFVNYSVLMFGVVVTTVSFVDTDSYTLFIGGLLVCLLIFTASSYGLYKVMKKLWK